MPYFAGIDLLQTKRGRKSPPIMSITMSLSHSKGMRNKTRLPGGAPPDPLFPAH